LSSNVLKLSVAPEDIRRYIHDQLVPLGAESVWLVGSRSKRKGKVPKPDSDWDLEVTGNVPTPMPTPADFGIFAEVHKVTTIKTGAVMLYPNWDYTDADNS
jgi:hypothetical protein